MRAIGLMARSMTKEDIYIIRLLIVSQRYVTKQASSSVTDSVDPAFGSALMLEGSMKENFMMLEGGMKQNFLNVNPNHTGMEFLK